MSQFDKIFPREILTAVSDQQIVDGWRQKKKEGYIAALNWVLDGINFHYGEELSDSDIVLDIQQELEEGKK